MLQNPCKAQQIINALIIAGGDVNRLDKDGNTAKTPCLEFGL